MRLVLLLATLLLASSPLVGRASDENIRSLLTTHDFSMEVVKPDGSNEPFQRQNGWQTLHPQAGEPYALRLTNTTNERIMVLVAIDGRDPYTGRQTLLGGKGPVIDPGKSLLLRMVRPDKKSAAQPLQLDPSRNTGVIDVFSFRERMDYPHLLPWSDTLAKQVGGEVRPGPTRGELLWLPPSGAPFRRLQMDPSSSIHVEYGARYSITNGKREP